MARKKEDAARPGVEAFAATTPAKTGSINSKRTADAPVRRASVQWKDKPPVEGVAVSASRVQEAAEALRKVHERLVLAQHSSGAGLWDWDLTTGRVDWSPELFRLFHLDPGLTAATLDAWHDIVHPEDRSVAQARIEQAIANRVPLVHEYRIVTPGGEVRWITTLGDTTYDEQGTPLRMVGICLDITQRVTHETELLKLNRTLRAHSRSDQAMMRAEEESAYAQEVCRIIVEDCGHAMVWIGLAENDARKNVRPIASAGFEEGYLDTLNVTWADTERGRGPTGTAIRTGQPSSCADMRTDPEFAPWREEALRRGYASSVVLPCAMDGRVFSAITIYSREPNAFSPDEIQLLSKLADDLAFGLVTLRMRDAHKHAAALLKQSEQRYRALFEGMTEGFALHEIIVDGDGVPCDYRFLDVNPAFERLTGLRARDVLGRTHNEVLPNDGPQWVPTYGKVALTGEPIHFEDYSDALARWYEVVSYRPAPGQFAVILMDVTRRKQAEEETLRHVEELKAANEELGRFNRAAVDREVRMIELKMQVNKLCAQAGQPLPYPLDFEKGTP